MISALSALVGTHFLFTLQLSVYSYLWLSIAATLIEGPSDAHIVYTYPAAQLGIDESCAISGNLAVCTVLAASGSLATETAVETESVVPFEVQGGVAAASASAGSSPVASTPVPSGSSAASASSKSSGSSGPSQTSGTSVSPSTTGSGGANGAVVHLPSVALTLCAAALGGFVFAGW